MTLQHLRKKWCSSSLVWCNFYFYFFGALPILGLLNNLQSFGCLAYFGAIEQFSIFCSLYVCVCVCVCVFTLFIWFVNGLYFLLCFAGAYPSSLLGLRNFFCWDMLFALLRSNYELYLVGIPPWSFLPTQGLDSFVHLIMSSFLCVDDVHPFKKSYRLFFVWTMYIHLRNLIVFSC